VLWWAFTAVSCAVGMTLARAELGTGGLLVCWSFTTLLATCIVLAVRGPRFRGTNWVRLSILAGVMSTAALGVGMGLGAAGVVWILAIAATSRVGRRLVHAWPVDDRPRDTSDDPVTRAASAVTPAPAPDLPTATLRDLDDEALCLAWRRSFVQLQQATSASVRMLRVQQRQLLLDELERRNPDGLAAWLASGCRAAGNPLPYLARTRSISAEGTGSAGTAEPPEADGDGSTRRAS
jgi:hypothetical protein